MLLLQQITDDLLPVVHVLGEDLLRDSTGPGLVVPGELLHVVGREPAGPAVQCSLPPPAVLLLCHRDDVAFLELELEK